MKAKLYKNYMKVISALLILSTLGCTYSGTVKESSLYESNAGKGRLPEKITLLEDKSKIDNVNLQIDAMTLSYDLKGGYFDASKRMLESVFAKVDVAPSPNPTNEYYAVPRLRWSSSTHGGAFDRGVSVDIVPSIDLYNTKTGALIRNYSAHTTFEHEKGGTTKSMMVLNGATLYLASPVAVNVATQSEGNAAQPKLENAIRVSLNNIKDQIRAGDDGTRGVVIAGKGTVKNDPISDCMTKIREDQNLAILLGKVISSGESDGFNRLTNNSKPTKSEKSAIRLYHDEYMGCFKFFQAALSGAPMEVRTIQENFRSGVSSLLASLYNGEISYGTYARKYSDLFGTFQQSADAVFAENARQDRADARANAQIEMQSEIATRQAIAAESIAAAQRQANGMQAFQNIQQNMLQYQMINSINRLSYPSSSGRVDCTSRALGDTINTSCY